MRLSQFKFLIILFYCFAAGLNNLFPQVPEAVVRGGFVVPEFDSQNRRRSVLYGEEALYISNRIYLINGLKIETYNDKEQVSWTVEAPKCYFNYNTRSAYSDGSLTASSVDSQFFISGVGFEWKQTDSFLTISNNVKTKVRIFSKSTNAPRGVLKQEFEISSGTFSFKSRQSEAFYSKGVKVVELPIRSGQTGLLKMESDELICKLLEKGEGLEKIQANYNVKIQEGENRASSHTATYYATNDQIHLFGSPKWFTEDAEGSADTIVLDRKNQQFIAVGHNYAKAKGPTAQLFGLEGLETNRTGRTNIEIFSEKLSVKLPERDKPIQNFVAEGDVKVAQGESFIKSEKALFNSSKDKMMLEFFDKVNWRLRDINGNADFLEIDRLANRFSAKGSSYLVLQRETEDKIKKTRGNVKMEVYSDEFVFQSNRVDFTGNVKLSDNNFRINCSELTLFTISTNRLGSLLAKNNVIIEQEEKDKNLTNGFWRLECKQFETMMDYNGINPEKITTKNNVKALHSLILTNGVKFVNIMIDCGEATFVFRENTNEVKSITASNNVYLIQKRISTNNSIYTNISLRCNQLDVSFMENARNISAAVARNNVVVERPSATQLAKLYAQFVKIQNSETTNAVDFIFALNNVVIDYGKTFAIAREAMYTATNDIVRLLGEPVLNMEAQTTNQLSRRIEVSSTESLLWHRTDNKFQAIGPYQVRIMLDGGRSKKFGLKTSGK